MLAEVIRQYWKSASKPSRQHLGGAYVSSLIPDGTMFWHRLTARFTEEESNLLSAYGGWDEQITVTVTTYQGSPINEHVTPRGLFGGVEFATAHPSVDWESQILEGLAGVLKWVSAADDWDGEQTTTLDPF